MWETPGGAVQAGETSRQGMARELREETGICAPEEAFTLLDRIAHEDVIFDVYLLRKDVRIDGLTLQAGETVAAKWVTLAEMETMTKEGEIPLPVMQRLENVRIALEKAMDS